jgi:IPT/TIG domain
MKNIQRLTLIGLSIAIPMLFSPPQAEGQTVYIGNSLTPPSGSAADSSPPLVILGEYNPASPSATASSSTTLPTGSVLDVKFYGKNYNFTLYALSRVGAGSKPNEQTFKVVSSTNISGSFSAPGSIFVPIYGFTVNAGDLLAFAGTGPYYPQSANDAANSDATYENASNPGSFTATPPAPGSTFTVGLHGDASPNYDFVTDAYQNQGRTYAIGVDVAVTSPNSAYIGNSLNVLPYNFDGADGFPPLVILGEFNASGPSATASAASTLPAGTLKDVRFYGQNYNFTLYELSHVAAGPNANEQKFQVVASHNFSGSASAPQVQTLTASFPLYAGDLLAFAGTGPFYSMFPNDVAGSDATYEDASHPGSFTATPPGAGSTFTVGLHGDASANYDYIADTYSNQGRTYAIGVDVAFSGAFLSFTPANGSTPQALQPGTTVTIAGSGFNSSSVITFGNNNATCSPSFVSGDGTQLQAQVPRLATSGFLTVTTGGATLSSLQPFTVDSYRNTSGFSFQNDGAFSTFVGGYNVDGNVTELFGSGQTTFTIGICPACITEDNPLAALFTWVANQVLNDGQCFGFSLASQRLLHYDQPYANPPVSGLPAQQIFPLQPGANSETPWNLQGPNDNFSSQIANYIHVQHLAQLSVEFLGHYVNQSWNNALSASSSSISNAIASDLASGDHPLIAIADGIGNGHVLVAYDLEPGSGNDYCFIDVYDCDIPFVTAENSQDGSTHQRNVQTSRISLTENNNWSYSGVLSGAPWGGGFNTLIWTGYGVVPVTPTMPTSPGAVLNLLTTIIFGGAAQTTQISDSAGHTMFNTNGTLNTNAATAIPFATPFAPLTGNSSGSAQVFLLGTNGNYTLSVGGASNGTYSASVVGSQSIARVIDVPIGPTIHDTLNLVSNTPGLTYSTDASNKPVTLQVMARATNGMVRNAILTTTTHSGAMEQLYFSDVAGDTISFSHTGPASVFTLALTQPDNQGNTTVFISPTINIDSNSIVSFSPSNWLALATSPVLVTTRDEHSGLIQTKLKSAGAGQILPGGAFSVTLPGNVGLTYQLQASSNLVSWVPLGLVTNVTGLIRYTDTNTAEFRSRFYRAVEQ